MRVKLLCLLALLVVTSPLVATPVAQAQSTPTVAATSQIVLQRVNYANDTATIWVYLALNTPGSYQSLDVYLQVGRVLYGPITLLVRGSNATASILSNGNGAYITLPLHGSPSFFPVDSYALDFNFTTVAGFYFNETVVNQATPYITTAPTLARQFALSTASLAWVHSKVGTVGEVSLTLDRKDWVAWATLGPLFLIYVMIGFLSLLPVDREKVYNRMILQFLIFAIIIGYYLTISNSLPPTPGFLPLVQVLTYVGLTSVTAFMILSILTHVLNWRVLTADSIAIAMSVVLLDFFLFTLIFSNELLALTYYKLVLFQLGATLALVAGTVIGLIKWLWDDKFREAGKALLIFPLGPPQDSVVNWCYGVALTLNFGALLLTTYVVQVLNPSVELTPLHRLVYQYTAGNFFLSGASNLAINLVIFAGAYLWLRRVSRKIWAAAGILLFVGSLYDFVNDSFLVPSALGPLGTIALPVAFILIVWAFSAVYGETIKERMNKKLLRSDAPVS